MPLIGPVLHGVRQDWPAIDERMIRIEAVRRMIGVMIADVLAGLRDSPKHISPMYFYDTLGSVLFDRI